MTDRLLDLDHEDFVVQIDEHTVCSKLLIGHLHVLLLSICTLLFSSAAYWFMFIPLSLAS